MLIYCAQIIQLKNLITSQKNFFDHEIITEIDQNSKPILKTKEIQTSTSMNNSIELLQQKYNLQLNNNLDKEIVEIFDSKISKFLKNKFDKINNKYQLIQKETYSFFKEIEPISRKLINKALFLRLLNINSPKIQENLSFDNDQFMMYLNLYTNIIYYRNIELVILNLNKSKDLNSETKSYFNKLNNKITSYIKSENYEFPEMIIQDIIKLKLQFMLERQQYLISSFEKIEMKEYITYLEHVVPNVYLYYGVEIQNNSVLLTKMPNDGIIGNLNSDQMLLNRLTEISYFEYIWIQNKKFSLKYPNKIYKFICGDSGLLCKSLSEDPSRKDSSIEVLGKIHIVVKLDELKDIRNTNDKLKQEVSKRLEKNYTRKNFPEYYNSSLPIVDKYCNKKYLFSADRYCNNIIKREILGALNSKTYTKYLSQNITTNYTHYLEKSNIKFLIVILFVIFCTEITICLNHSINNY